MSELIRRSVCWLSIHNSPPSFKFLIFNPRWRSRGNLLLYCDCPHFNKDTRLAKYTVCKKLLTYVHPQTPKLFRNIKVPPYTQGHEISKVRGIAVISLKFSPTHKPLHINKDTKFQNVTVCKEYFIQLSFLLISNNTPHLLEKICSSCTHLWRKLYSMHAIPPSLIREKLPVLHPPFEKDFISCATHLFTY